VTVKSTVAASGACFITDWTPFSQARSVLWRSLAPITLPLVAVRLNRNCPPLGLRAKRAWTAALRLTNAMPLIVDGFLV
jgi:hypothetical protein